MATVIKLNDGTNPCVAINGVYQATPVNGEITAADIVYVLPCTYRAVARVTAYVSQNNTIPVPYVFECASLAAFQTFLSGLSVTTTLATYTKLKKLMGSKNNSPLTALPSVLVNTLLILKSTYTPATNETAMFVGAGSQYYPNIQLTLLGNQDATGASATASLSVPILASPANGDILTALINGVVIGTYTVVSSPSQATVKTAVDALFNSNGYGFTFVGTLGSNIDVLAGTAPTKGTFYNGNTVSFTRTGTTFGASNVSATFTGGV